MSRHFPHFIWPTFLLVWGLATSGLFGQVSRSQSPLPTPTTTISTPVSRESNNLWNTDPGLSHFFECLEELQENRRDQVVVVHIGDSHIQADWFSGTVRMSLQKAFGNAGRGLVFPFRQARTNAPPDIRSSSNVSWSSRRITSSRSNPSVGISGFGLRTSSPYFQLSLQVEPNNQGLDYSFDRVTFFTDKGPGSYDLWVGDQRPELIGGRTTEQYTGRVHRIVAGESLSSISSLYRCTISDLMSWNGLADTKILAGTTLNVDPVVVTDLQQIPRYTTEGIQLDLSSNGLMPYLSSLRLPQQVDKITVNGMHDQASQQHLTLYGLVLEKEHEQGVLYHAIGANGAQVDHYLRSEIFWEQLSSLNPDLVIISLGTNETVSTSFRPERFAGKIKEMVTLVKQAAPETSVLLTTPPDALRQGSQVNSSMPECSASLLDLAMSQDYSAWDFFGVMGGSGSIYTWQQRGLAQRDGIHFTKAGYELQGSLLHQALIEAYGRYLSHSSR